MTRISLIALAATAGTAAAQFVGFGDQINTFFPNGGPVPTGAEVRDMIGADLSGDGRADIVALLNTGAIFYFKGQEVGVFDEVFHVSDPDTGGQGLGVLDIDGDNDLDVMRTSEQDNGELRVFRNDGNDQFALDFVVTGLGNVAPGPGLRTGDADNDGDADAFVLLCNGVTIVENTGSTLSTTPHPNVFNNFDGKAIAVGDLDGDNRADAVVLNAFDDRLVVLGSSGLTLSERTRIVTGGVPRDVKMFDIDLDGDLDVLAAVDNFDGGAPAIRVFENDGAGNLSLRYTIATTSAGNIFEIEAGDVDADGDVDLLAFEDPSESNSIPNRIVVYLNNGSGVFGRQSTTFASPSTSFDEAFELMDLVPSTGLDFVIADANLSNSGDSYAYRPNLTPFTAPEPFVLMSPPDGARELAAPGSVDAWGMRVAPLVTWDAAVGLGVVYDLVIATDPGLSNTVHTANGLTDRFADISDANLQDGMTYHWQVTARNSEGQLGAANGPYSFGIGPDCLADLTDDGTVDIFDVLEYLGIFDTGCP